MNKSAIVFHIPHSSMHLPPEYLSGVVLTDEELRGEMLWATDMYCDELFDTGYGVPVVAEFSRFACDAERFRNDEEEPNAAAGQGFFYTHTMRGIFFRQANSALKEKAALELYDPHHAQLEAAVQAALNENPRCLIIDGHSFCDDDLIGANLPDFCIGSDPFHTPEALVNDMAAFLRDKAYRVAVNYPFAGALVPQKWYRKDVRVLSIMVEINKRLYLENDMITKRADFVGIKNLCADMIATITKNL